MSAYSSFTIAYEEERFDKLDRVSYDIPGTFREWKQIVDSTPILVIYVWSDNCRPCHLVRDKFESLAHSLQDEDIIFYKDNIDLPTSIHRNQVEVVPTFIIVCDGHEMSHPTYKSRYTGWSDEIRDAVRFFHSVSQRAAGRAVQREQQGQEPKIICKNNVCYIQNDWYIIIVCMYFIHSFSWRQRMKCITVSFSSKSRRIIRLEWKIKFGFSSISSFRSLFLHFRNEEPSKTRYMFLLSSEWII